MKKRQNKSEKNDISKYLLIIVCYAILTIPFVEWPGSVLKNNLVVFIKAVVFYYFTVTFVTSETRLKIFLYVFLACQTFRVFEPLFLHITQGYWGSFAYIGDGEVMNRLAGAPHDVINPNGLAFIILTIIPFYYYLSSFSWKHKLLFLTVIPLSIYTLVLTGSRSGLLALFMIMAAIFYKSKKKLLLTCCFYVGIIVVIANLNPQQLDRYISIIDNSTKNAATAAGRISGIENDIKIALRRPIFGHGLGTSLEANFVYSGSALVSHNLYAELAQELGFVGLIMYLLFLKSIIKNFRQSKKIFSQTPKEAYFLYTISNAMQVWLAMNILFSFASYGLSSYQWYLFAGFAFVLSKFASQIKERTQVTDASEMSFSLTNNLKFS